MTASLLAGLLGNGPTATGGLGGLGGGGGVVGGGRR